MLRVRVNLSIRVGWHRTKPREERREVRSIDSRKRYADWPPHEHRGMLSIGDQKRTDRDERHCESARRPFSHGRSMASMVYFVKIPDD
jgi:hypothetical protein